MPYKQKRSRGKVIRFSFDKNIAGLLIFASGAASGYIYYDQNKEPQIIQTADNVTLQPCFTPRYKCLPVILKQIAGAQRSIRMMAYSFTSQPISSALIAAKQRGINVQLILDKSQTDQHSQRQILNLAGIPIYIDSDVAIAHNKVIIIDDHTVLTGSYNYSVGAESRNAENVIVIHNPQIAQAYTSNWQSRQRQSVLLNNHRVQAKKIN